MPTPIEGDETQFPESFNIPADNDLRNAASVNVAFEALADRTAYLKNLDSEKLPWLEGQGYSLVLHDTRLTGTSTTIEGATIKGDITSWGGHGLSGVPIDQSDITEPSITDGTSARTLTTHARQSLQKRPSNPISPANGPLVYDVAVSNPRIADAVSGSFLRVVVPTGNVSDVVFSDESGTTEIARVVASARSREAWIEFVVDGTNGWVVFAFSDTAGANVTASRRPS